MIDIETHRIVDLIDSRDYDDVTQWLKTFKNLNVISRDGSITYKNAISNAHPDSIQISDRFHLLKNLTEYCKAYLKTKFNSIIRIKKDNVNSKMSSDRPLSTSFDAYLTLEEKFYKAQLLLEEKTPRKTICQLLHIDNTTLNKLLKMNSANLEKYFKTIREKRQDSKLEKKKAVVQEARKMHLKNIPLVKIAADLGIHRTTAKKYVDPNFSPIDKRRNSKKKSILDPYMKIIDKMFEQGIVSKTIYQTIQQAGYKGSASTLRLYCSNLKKNKPNDSTLGKSIKRNHIIKLLYLKKGQLTTLTSEEINQVKQQYPFLMKILNVVTSFRKILKYKNVKQLIRWIENIKKLDNSYLNSFINGITRDLDAVKNSIIYDYNNGLAEGSVNKLKVIKRIMYGRNNFEMLRAKVLKLEQRK